MADASGMDPELAVEASTRAAMQAVTPRAMKWTSPAERALQLGVRGMQLPTHVDTLNKACRGGPRTTHFVVLGGAPGSGKTTLAVDWGLRLAKAGIHVAILAADEAADGLLIRIGQNLGFRRDDLEPPDTRTMSPEERAGVEERFLATRTALSERLAEIPTLMLVDAEEERCTVEALSTELRARRGSGPSVLILDSIQRVTSAAPIATDSPRARVEAAVNAAVHAQKIDGHLVLATCELSRAAYRGGKEEAIDDLAAFAESRAVEYSATTALVMRSVVEQDWLVDVSMCKNRNGTKKAFRLRLDPWRAQMHEVGVDPVADEDEQQAKGVDIMRARVLKAVAREPLTSASEVAIRVKAKKTTVLAVVKEMLKQGLLVMVDGTLRAVPKGGS